MRSGSCTATRRSRSRRCCSPSTRPSRWPGRRPTWGADLLVVHHPLFLRGGARVRRDHAEGAHARDAGPGRVRAAHRAHQRRPGRPRRLRRDGAGARPDGPPSAARRGRRRSTSSPSTSREADADRVRGALAEAGAGRIGEYEAASFSSPGEGRFRPLEGASPTIGEVGELEVVGEERVEVVLDRRRRSQVVARDAGRASLRDAGVGRRRSSPTRGTARHRRRPGRRRRADHARRRSPQHVAERAAADRPRRPGRRRPGRAPYAGWRWPGERATSCWATRSAARRRRVRDQRPAPPPGDRVRREGRPGAGRRLRTGRPSGPGCRRWRRGWRGPGYGGDPRQHDLHRRLDGSALVGRACRARGAHPESRPRRPAEAARPPGARRARRPAALPARHAARARRPRRADDDPARPRRPGPRRAHRRRRPDRRAGQGRRRRRAGQDPPRPRPRRGSTRA